ncbi:hypothetical protein GMB51_13915 [Turicibacter sanguinis]|nr:hypothetical protein [Turicibacter sanguinis]MTN52048.1 hypothetical protein [Turicibacter sanguinis]MTN55106.1 hypothetical protein [Turicibacter sanguinis]MTN58313.1 hypothetical protein [Turicibacter sanguinis]MTN61403.1 hypothetical protein [Turicibacter sanguinis]
MLSIRTELKEGLTKATGMDVYFVQPPVNADVAIPLLILEEKANNQYYRDRNSHMEIVNLSYDISIYVDEPEQLFKLMGVVDDYMHGVGLKRNYTSADMNIDNRLWCKTMTYNCKAALLKDGTIQISN